MVFQCVFWERFVLPKYACVCVNCEKAFVLLCSVEVNSIEHSDLYLVFAFRKAKMTARDSQKVRILPESVWERHTNFPRKRLDL